MTGGTENHLVLWDVRPHGITGSKLEKLYERACLSVNKNTIHGDKSAAAPGGVRLGTPAMTTRGFTEEDFDKVAEYLDRGLKIALKIQEKSGKKIKDFETALKDSEELVALRKDVANFAKPFPYPC